MSKLTAKSRNPQIVHEAAEWFVELTTGEVTARQRKAFDAWIRQSPEHIRAYLAMFPLWEDAARIDAAGKMETHALIELAVQAPDSISSLRFLASDPRAASKWLRRSGWAIAATLILAVGVAVPLWYSNRSPVYTTQIGEQRHIELPDGSSIELNAHSRLKIRFSERERAIALEAGQALFRVAKDPERPFLVRSGATQVRAVGTQFDVYRRQSGTTVTVLEGMVSATTPSSNPVLLSAGEQITVSSKELATPRNVDVSAATAWRHQQVVFSSTPLPQVAEEFNRYNAQRLILADATLDEFNVSGVFSSSDLASFLRFLRAQPNIAITETPDEIRIASR